MNLTDWERFRRSVGWAIRTIEKDAFCFRYDEEPEYEEFSKALDELWKQTFGADRPRETR